MSLPRLAMTTPAEIVLDAEDTKGLHNAVIASDPPSVWNVAISMGLAPRSPLISASFSIFPYDIEREQDFWYHAFAMSA